MELDRLLSLSHEEVRELSVEDWRAISGRLVSSLAEELGTPCDFGDSQYFANGEFCGTRGQSRRVEGIRVRVDRR
ncbi:hypothetical protein [Nannocystis punicea]|uniref:Uncharacterized protein n=1 Tax=Nannocystis punicea TaxID=2995304 RepID=A0ABY7GXD7_9BACT|nr:hypothetical protein [Nannocystis poenicansa]WAS91608.1 hypothetical protein O0S08_35960 [Nannocystis poenicansa]